MKKTQRIISLLFVGLASAALFVACGDDETSCLEDADCGAANEICVVDVCKTTCTSITDCAEGETCSGVSGDSLYCEPGTPTNNTNNNSNNNSNNNTVNNTNNNSNNLTPAPQVIMVKDTTTGNGCTETDPGSDIMNIVLQDIEGGILGYAEYVGHTPGEEPNGNDHDIPTLLFDGEPKSFGTECAETFDGNVHALGCGGTLLVRFYDDSRNPLTIDSSNQISVVEWGPQCGGSADDSLEVYLCSDPVTSLNGDETSCTDLIASGPGGVVIADNL